jgi:hypothetical protein
VSIATEEAIPLFQTQIPNSDLLYHHDKMGSTGRFILHSAVKEAIRDASLFHKSAIFGGH